MGLQEKHHPTNSNMHLIEFFIHLSIVFTRLALKKHNPIYIWPSNPPHQKLVFVHSQMTGCPKSDKGGGQFPYSLFFNYPINRSSSLELPSFSKEVMLRSVRKAFWEDWLGFLCLFQSIQDELACVNEALNAVHKTGLSPTVQLWPRLVHALFLLRTRYRITKGIWQKKRKKKEEGGPSCCLEETLHLKTVSDMLIPIHTQQFTLWQFSTALNSHSNPMEQILFIINLHFTKREAVAQRY